jgi:Ca2+-binding EF-hand superfamily protein
MSNVKRVISLGMLGVVAGGFLAINTQAGQGSQGGPPPFSDFDLDADGFVSEEEFNTVRGQHMAAKAAEGKQMKGAATAPAFADIDKDGDGQLNPEELSAAQRAHMAERHGKGNGHGHGKGQGSGCGKGEGMKQNMPAFSDFDLDGNGVIVETEFNEGHAKKMSEMAAAGHQMKHAKDAPGFKGIDSDDNGEISKDEFSVHQAEQHPKMHDSKNKVEN